MFKMSNCLIKRKIRIINGEPTLIQPQMLEDIDIDINALDEELFKRIQSEVLDKMTQEQLKDEKYFTYKIFPYIVNIDMDINYKEYLSLMSNPPKVFSFLLEMVVDEINDLFETGKELQKISDKVENIKENNKEIFKEIEIKKDNEDDELEQIKALLLKYEAKRK